MPSRACVAAAVALLLAAPGRAQPPAESAWRQAVARQAALDRAGFSPGLIDGAAGRKTAVALRAFQVARGLPASGRFDAATETALAVDAEPATHTCLLTAADLADVGPVPQGWK